MDLSPDIILPEDWQKKYVRARLVLILSFLSGCVFFARLVLFPPANFDFFFRTPQATKNTIVNPHQDKDMLFFDTALSQAQGDFSDIRVKLILENDSRPVKNNSEIAVRKSYQAFFYPEGDPVTAKYERVPDLPFSDGSLIASGISVYIVSGDTVYPVNNPATFLSMGYAWDDVIKATSEELAAYRKGKLFSIASPHPDGTVFSEKESGKYYLVENGMKRRLEGPEIIESYLSKNPVLADEKSLLTESRCALKKDLSLFNVSYSCQVPIENLAGLTGNDFQYAAGLGKDVKIKELHVIFKKMAGWENFKLALSNIKKNIIANFYGQPR